MQIQQQTEYPWHGVIKLTIHPQQPTAFTLCVRIPGWAQGQPVPSDLYHYLQASSLPVEIKVNGEKVVFAVDKGYAQLQRTWQRGDVVEVTLSMPIHRVVSHPNVQDNVGKVALERGPLVYCAEGVDNNEHVLNKVLRDDDVLNAESVPDLLDGVTVIHAPQRDGKLIFIPYYAWAERGVGEMAVWLKRG